VWAMLDLDCTSRASSRRASKWLDLRAQVSAVRGQVSVRAEQLSAILCGSTLRLNARPASMLTLRSDSA
jgi:hypothetical protein